MANWRVLTTVDPDFPDAVSSSDLLLPNQAAARARAATERVRPGVMKASVHLCPHAAGEPASEWWDCRNDVRSQYEEL